MSDHVRFGDGPGVRASDDPEPAIGKVMTEEAWLEHVGEELSTTAKRTVVDAPRR